MSALGSPGDVHEGDRGVQLETGDGARPRARAKLGPEGIARHDHSGCGKTARPVGERDRDSARETGPDPVREPGHRRLLVEDDRQSQERRGEHHGKRDKAARAEYDAGPEGSQDAEHAQRAHRDVHEEVRHVLPRPVAPELAGGDGDVRDSAPGHLLGLDAGPRADPGARPRALTQEGRDG